MQGIPKMINTGLCPFAPALVLLTISLKRGSKIINGVFQIFSLHTRGEN